MQSSLHLAGLLLTTEYTEYTERDWLSRIHSVYSVYSVVDHSEISGHDRCWLRLHRMASHGGAAHRGMVLPRRSHVRQTSESAVPPRDLRMKWWAVLVTLQLDPCGRLFYRQPVIFTRLPALDDDWLRDSESHGGRRAYETCLETPPSRD